MEFPRGTVTFLMTDIEGSTKLWESDPDAMGGSLERHDAAIANAVTEHMGVVVKRRGEGDSVFCVFGRAGHAVAAALEAQEALSAARADPGLPLRVRMAVHSGDAELRDGDYYGPAVNRCARLRAICHGGQVVLTIAAAELARDDLPKGAILRDLGEHFLRDIARPEPVYQLVHPALDADFPPLKSPGRQAHNLPLELTSFIGRDQEIAEALALLQAGRLVTLAGPGGVGKTRLAVQVGRALARDSGGGVWFVDLAGAQRAGEVLEAVATTLGLREQAGRSLTELVRERLMVPDTVLILDNCEHLLDAVAADVGGWLHSSESLRVLATSREPLGIEGEKVLRVASLAPGPAAQLFTERAELGGSRERDAELISAICERLDGLPLAIELAAVRAGTIALSRMLERIDSRLALSASRRSGFAPRQQTLRATVEWSHQLLEPGEQILFRRLAVFTGGFQLESAEAVARDDALAGHDVADLLSRLVEKSLVVRGDSSDGSFRYRLLQTIRDYALERLESTGDALATRRRHAEHMLALAEEAVPNLQRRTQRIWLARVADELDNFRTAVLWSREPDPRLHRRLVAQLAEFWLNIGHVDEIAQWVERAIAVDPNSEDACQASLLEGRGRVADMLGRYSDAMNAYHAALNILEALADQSGIAACLNKMGVVSALAGDIEEAAALLKRSHKVAVQAGDLRTQAQATTNLASLRSHSADEASREMLEEALRLWDQLGDEWSAAAVLNNLGDGELKSGDSERALSRYRESITLLRSLGTRSDVIVSDIQGCAGVAASRGDHARALRLAGGAQSLLRQLGFPMPPFQGDLVKEWLAPAYAALGPEAAGIAWHEGEQLGFDALVSYALTDT